MSAGILIIDDHVAIARGLEQILAPALPGSHFGYAGDEQAAIEQVRLREWDTAVVDLNLPGRGGLDLVDELKTECPRLGVLVYSMYSEAEFGIRAMQVGADGYLTKDADATEIIRAVQRILAGGRYLTPGLADELARRGKNSEALATSQALSNRELTVIQKLAAGKRPTEIADELALSVKTVSTYRARILEKLGLRTTAELIRYAIDHDLE
ncbi:MAG: response regulator transcription factor [Acidobacteria bacterium]|nr:response regulator transcription factor [Acidobacteriota bacterium]